MLLVVEGQSKVIRSSSAARHFSGRFATSALPGAEVCRGVAVFSAKLKQL